MTEHRLNSALVGVRQLRVQTPCHTLSQNIPSSVASDAGKRSLNRRNMYMDARTSAGSVCAALSIDPDDDTSILVHEHLDIKRGELMMSRKDEFEALIRARWKTDDGEDEPCNAVDWKALRITLDVAKILGGSLPVSYEHTEQSEGFGRMQAFVKVNLETNERIVPFVYMPREVRATLAADRYVDVDVVNCQPVLLRQRLENAGFACECLAQYVDDRDACLSRVMKACGVDRDAAKQLFVRMVYGGSEDTWARDNDVDANTIPDFVHALYTEIRDLGDRLMSKRDMDDLRDFHTREYAHRFPNTPGGARRRAASLMAIHLQTEEAKCIKVLVAAARGSRRKVGGIIYDGIHVERECNDPDCNLHREMIEQWEGEILKHTGYRLTLAVKPFINEWITAPPAASTVSKWNDGSRMLTYNDMKACFEQNVFKIEMSNSYYLYAPELKQYKIVSEAFMLGAFKHLTYYESGNLMTPKSFIARWMRDNKLRRFLDISLAPPPKTTTPEVFNLWTPFNVAMVDDNLDDNAYVKAFQEFVTKLLGRDAPVIKYVLDWCAQMVQQPGKKTGIALILKGEQGVGKNVFTNALRAVVGADKFLQTATPATTLFGRFTNLREGRILIVINESNGMDNFAASETIKDMITCDEFICEGKGTNSYPVSCCARFIFTTNLHNIMR
ncbi:hypothetical protein CEUSTIGMA_g12790.t1, partial [Chlamydomonas eustigma]